MITAKEARERTESPAAIDKLMARLHNEISLAADNGRSQATWWAKSEFVVEVCRRLEAAGFGVTVSTPDGGESRLTISW